MEDSVVCQPCLTLTHVVLHNPAGDRLVPLLPDKAVQENRPEPQPGEPYLNSARLGIPLVPPRLQKGMLYKLKALLQDLGIPARPVPTKTVADMYDELRRDIVELFTLQKQVKQKEQQVEALRQGQPLQQVAGKYALGAPTEGGLGRSASFGPGGGGPGLGFPGQAIPKQGQKRLKK